MNKTLELADRLEHGFPSRERIEAAAELRRLHEENKVLRDALETVLHAWGYPEDTGYEGLLRFQMALDAARAALTRSKA